MTLDGRASLAFAPTFSFLFLTAFSAFQAKCMRAAYLLLSSLCGGSRRHLQLPHCLVTQHTRTSS